MEEALPNFCFYRITDITPEFLKENNIKGIGIDLDNTTVYDSSYIALRGVKEWIKSIKAADIPIIIITNTYPIRAVFFSKKFGVPYISLSNKPHTKNVKRAAEKLGVNIHEFALIGDMLFYDVKAANRSGAVSIKVEPFSRHKTFKKKNAKRRAKETAFIEEHKQEYPKIRGSLREKINERRNERNAAKDEQSD